MLDILNSSYGCLRNLWRNLGLFGYMSSRVFRCRLDLGQVGPMAVRVGVKRINSGVVRRRGGMLLKLAV